MKILKLKFSTLHNEGHFQFHTDFKKLVEQHDVSTLNIKARFTAYLALYAKEDEALEVIRKSAITAQISESDRLRDNTFGGLRDSIEAAQKHFDLAKREASRVLMVLIDHYRKTPYLALDDETAAIHSLLKELRGTYKLQIESLGITDWVDKLDHDNRTTESLINQRDNESAGKTKIRMKDIRKEIDQAYRDIVERIEACIVIGGVGGYEKFVNELNARIERYKK